MTSKAPDPEQRAKYLDLLDAGQWLTSTEAAIVLRCARRTVANMLDDGRLPYRLHPGGRWRLIDPDALRAVMVAMETTHRGRTTRIAAHEPSPPE